MRGFTLVEILITVAIGLILSVIGLSVYGNMQSESLVFDSAKQAVQTLRLAKEKNLSGLHNVSHGVYFILNSSGADSMVLYEGNSYASRDVQYDRKVDFSGGVDVAAQNFVFSGNDVDINFSGPQSIPNNTGTILMSQPTTEVTLITVADNGLINW